MWSCRLNHRRIENARPGKAVWDQRIEQSDQFAVAFEAEVVFDEIGGVAGEQVIDGGQSLSADCPSQQRDADTHAWLRGALGLLVPVQRDVAVLALAGQVAGGALDGEGDAGGPAQAEVALEELPERFWIVGDVLDGEVDALRVCAETVRAREAFRGWAAAR
jgi:hypothetical protein